MLSVKCVVKEDLMTVWQIIIFQRQEQSVIHVNALIEETDVGTRHTIKYMYIWHRLIIVD